MRRIFLIFPLPLLIFVFIVYWLTKPPSILWIDSGTMIAASKSLGIPNPPGFPFYMMASHLATLIPFGKVLTRLELFTIVFSVGLLFILFEIVKLVIKNFLYPAASEKQALLAAAFGTMTLAFSYQYWSQSQNTEAFLFSYFFVTLFAFLLLKLLGKRQEFVNRGLETKIYKAITFKILLLIAFLYGLAAGANPTVAASIPSVLFVMFLSRKALTPSKIFILGLVFLIPLALVYSYLPIRASSWPFVNWGNPQTLDLFIKHLRGAGLNINEPGPGGSINGFTGSPLVFAQSVSYFILNSFLQFTPFLWPLILIGGYQVFKRNRQVFGVLISVPIFNVVYSGIYLSGNQESWFILSWIFFAVFIAIGFFHLAQKAQGKKLMGLFSLCVLPLFAFIIPLNRSNHYYSADFAYNLYTPLEKNAILIGTGDFFDSLSHYLHEADIYRPDVTPITANVFYVNKWNRDTLRHTTNVSISNTIEQMIQYKSYSEYNEVMNQLIAENIDKHPIYVDHLTLRASALAGTTAGQLRLDSRFKFVPWGLSLKVVKANSTEQPSAFAYNYKLRSPLIKPFYLERNYRGAFGNILNDYIYGWEYLGNWYAGNGQDEKTLKYYKTAESLGENAEVLARIGEFWAERKDFNAAYQYMEKAERLDVNNMGIHFNLGLAYTNLGRNREAIREFESVKLLTRPDEEAYKEADKVIKQLNVIDLNDPNLKEETASWQTIRDQKNNLQLKIPPEFSANLGKTTLISDNNPGALGLNIELIGQEIGQNQNPEDLLKNSPLLLPGMLLDVQKINFADFNAVVQIYGTNSGESSQRFILAKNNWLWQFKVYPGNSSKLSLIYKILSTFTAIKN